MSHTPKHRHQQQQRERLRTLAATIQGWISDDHARNVLTDRGIVALMLEVGVCLDAITPRSTHGTWPVGCEQRAFVDGARWQDYIRGFGMSSSDQDRAEAEAVRRYGDPNLERRVCLTCTIAKGVAHRGPDVTHAAGETCPFDYS